MKVSHFIENLKSLYKDDEEIACHLWHEDDVFERIEEAKSKSILEFEDCVWSNMNQVARRNFAGDVLDEMNRCCDSEYGMTYTLLDNVLHNKISEYMELQEDKK